MSREANIRYKTRRRARAREQGICPACFKNPADMGYKLCRPCLDKFRSERLSIRDIINKRQRAERQKVKKQVIEHYGGKCVCCGETELAFLVIDHVNGGGNQHRKAVGISGGTLARWVKQHNFPDNFQILCANCNMAKSILGTCPHQTTH